MQLLCEFFPVSLASYSEALTSYETFITNSTSLARSSRVDSLSRQPLNVFRFIPEQTLLFWNKSWIRTNNRLIQIQLALLFAYFATYHHVLLQLLSTLLDTKYNTRYAFCLPATQPSTPINVHHFSSQCPRTRINWIKPLACNGLENNPTLSLTD